MATLRKAFVAPAFRVVIATATALVPAGVAGAQAPSSCGDFDASSTVAASDALLLLKKAVGQAVTLSCPPCPAANETAGDAGSHFDAAISLACGDLDGSGTVAASDALVLLKKAVGQDVSLSCPSCTTTTTTGSTTTTTIDKPAGCGNGRLDAGEECEGANGCGEGERCTGACSCAVSEKPPPTSQDLIAEALAASLIDYPTSLVYRAWALFADSRLPEQFDGAAWQSEDNSLFLEIMHVWNALDAGTQASLQPFILRPTEPGSYYDPAEPPLMAIGAQADAASQLVDCPYRRPQNDISDWRATGSEHFVVWSCGGGDAGQDPHADKRQIVSSLAEEVWSAMVSETGPVKPDTLVSGPTPTNRIDVYLVTANLCKWRGGFCNAIPLGNDGKPALAAAAPAAPCDENEGVSTSSSFALVSLESITAPTAPWPLRYTFAHEFFHMIQNSLNLNAQGAGCGNGQFETTVESWLVEATAEWAAWAYFPDDGASDRDTFFRLFQQRDTAHVSLLSYMPEPYDAFIYPFFVQQEKGDRKAIPNLWKNSSAATSPAALDDQLNAVLGFSEHFRDFAVRNMNVTVEQFPGDPLPLAQRHQKQTGSAIPENVKPHILEPVVELNFPVDEMQRDSKIQPLAAQYEHYKLDPNIKYVRLDLDTLGGASHADADVIVKVGANWSRRKLSNLTFEFCTDQDAVEEFYLILSNHAHGNGEIVDGHYLVTTEFECPSGWSGNFELEMTYDRVETGSEPGYQFQITETERERHRWTVSGSTEVAFPVPQDEIAIHWHGTYERTEFGTASDSLCPGKRLSASESSTATGQGSDTLVAYAAGGGQYSIVLAEPYESNEMTGTFETSFVGCTQSGTAAYEMTPLPEMLGLALSMDLAFLVPAPDDPKKYSGESTLLDEERPTAYGTERTKQVLRWDLYRR